MKKKFLTVLLALVAALCLCFGLAACDDKSSDPPVTQTNPNGGSAQEYTITYDANGGAFASGETFTQTVKENSALTAPTSPSRQYYTFAGWAKNKNGTEMWDFSNDKVTGNTTLYAKWAQKSATVLSVVGASIDEGDIFMVVPPLTSSVQLANKVVCSDDSYWQLYYDELGQTEIPTKVAANLGGGLSDGENVFYILVSSQDRTQTNTYVLTVYRQYTTHVTYRTNDTVYDTKDIVTGTPLTQSYDIACSVRGYTFNGWEHTEKFGENVWGPVTFTADLTANTYKLFYDANGGEGEIQGKEVKMDATTAVSSGAGFKRKYFTLSSFNTQADGGGETIALGSSMKFDFAENTTLYAIWDCDYNYTSSSNGITITGCKRLSSNVDFTDEFDGKPIVAIASQSFKDNTMLRQIVIPDSVKSIGAGAFSGCSNLTSITIPFVGGSAKKATDLYQYPFGYIFGTTSYTGGTAVEQKYYGGDTSARTSTTYYMPSALKDVIVTGCEEILCGAFYDCKGLTSVTIGSGVTSIGEDAFYDCKGLTSVTIGSGVTSIGNYAFGGCSGLTSVEIPDRVIEIGDYAFSHCSGLTSVTMGSGVTSIRGRAFYWCRGLTSIVIPDSVTSIGDSAFAECNGLKSVTIGSGVTEMGEHAFYLCSGLTGELKIPDNVTTIGDGAFWGCSGLISVTIGSGVASIGANAFARCSGLKTVYYKGTPSEWSGISIRSGNDSLTSATRYYYSAETPSAEQWAESENWWHYEADGETIALWTKEEV